MANINKIKLSGTTYNIQDLNATKTVELTQAEYDALSPKYPNVFYIITDATAGDLSNYYTKTETDGLLDTKLDVTAYTPTDLSNYYTKSETSGATEISTALASKADTATTYTKTETDNAITAATSTKQDALVSGTNIKTINNQSILGEGNITIEGGSGGGKAIEAGRGISITTGETADTVSFNLPIYSGTGEGSIIGGFSGNTASGKNSIALGGRYENWADYNYCKATNKGSVSFGGQATGQGAFTCGESTKASGRNAAAIGCYTGEASGVESFITGRENKAKGFTTFVSGFQNIGENDYEFVIGHLAKSNKANTTFGDSGNTLFSVGNGTADNARHNAFEIRQNGDIYISKDGQDVKLQDQLGGGTVDTEITSASTNPVTSAAIYNQFGGLKLVKLTQSEYDSLTTKDNSTLYVIVN